MEDISVTDFIFEEQELHKLARNGARALDNQLHVQFYKHAELNSFRSQAEGRKIFEDHVYIRIIAPANRQSVIERRATDEDKERFPIHYSRFLQGQEQLAIGTPLAELYGLTPSQVLELKALKVETVEQLANLPDTTVQLLGIGGQELKRRASAWLARASGTDALAAQNVQLQAEVAELKKLIQERLLAEKAAQSEKPAFVVTDASKKA